MQKSFGGVMAVMSGMVAMVLAAGTAYGVSATGGTVVTTDVYVVTHTFTNSGTFTVTSGGNVEVMVVAGGGGGGGGNSAAAPAPADCDIAPVMPLRRANYP